MSRRKKHLRDAGQSGRRRWRLPRLALFTAVIFFLGTILLLAPSIANWFSQLEQAGEIASLDDGIRDLGAETRHEAIIAAQQYNASLIGSAIVGEGERIPQIANSVAASAEAEYAALLRADERGLMARIKIPVIGVDLPVYHGTTDATLAEGVGHLEGTALPVGGEGTRSVLTGHRGLATSELFTNLDRLTVGDRLTIEVFGEVLTYQVVSTEVVAPDDSKALNPEVGRDLVTLVTCTPLGINSHRILVTGERVSPTPRADLETAGSPPTIPGYPWWIAVLSAVTLILIAYVWFAGRPARRRTTSDDSTPAAADELRSSDEH